MSTDTTRAPLAPEEQGGGATGLNRSLLRRPLRFLRPMAPALLAYTAVRAFGLLAMWLHPKSDLPGVSNSTLTRLATLWDAPYYQMIAVHGYSDDLGIDGYENGVPYSSRAFFPFYPMAIRAVHAVLPITAGHAALLVAWFFSLVAAAGIFAVVAHVYRPRIALIAVVLWGALPHGAVESMAYSEPVFTAWAAWSLYALLRRNWIWAGALSCMACLTRPSGLAVAAAVGITAAVELVQFWRGRRNGADRPVVWRVLLGTALAPAGWFGYLAYVGWQRGTWRGYFDVQLAWGTHFDFGRGTLSWMSGMILHPDSKGTTLDQVVMVGIVVASVVLFLLAVEQRQPLPLLVFGGMMLVIALGDGAYFAPRARFLLPAFVLLLPVAAGLSRIRSRVSLWVLLSSAVVCSGFYGVFLVFESVYSP
ncbi:hypothetical protein [Kitasatospora griseola]|uniref:hypothetical protein n=1 Tax=Kitasatospora griseola TaxID=2064 RepID=UPI003449184A